MSNYISCLLLPDTNGRYTYKKQPEICKWNLLKLAEAIKSAVPLDDTKKVLNEMYVCFCF